MFYFHKMRLATFIFSCVMSFSVYAEVTPAFVESVEQFYQIPTIAMDASDYLKKAKKTKRISRFIFVRHGESISNQEKSVAGRTLDVDLSEMGISQALETGVMLYENQVSLDAAYSSPSLRAIKTANFILELLAHEKSPQLDERLYEKFYGPYEGASEQEYAPIKKLEEIENSGPHKTFKEKFTFKAHSEMESLAEVYARTIHFINEVSHKHKGQNILVTTHNGVMKALFMADAAKLGLDIDYRSYDLSNCSVIVIEVEKKEICIKATSGLKFREKKN
jgi:broad specificity phosphatase PhoE